jgi:hypothetical protein
MFFQGNARKRYNGEVDHILTNYFKLDTSVFGAMKYLRRLDMMWHGKRNVNEAAIAIAGDWFESILEQRLYTNRNEVELLSGRMITFINESLQKKTMDPQRAEKMRLVLAQTSSKYFPSV